MFYMSFLIWIHVPVVRQLLYDASPGLRRPAVGMHGCLLQLCIATTYRDLRNA
jgi:hypothetical protein